MPLKSTPVIDLDIEDFAVCLQPIPTHSDTYIVARIENFHRPITLAARLQRVHIGSVIYRLQTLFSIEPAGLRGIRKTLEDGETVIILLRTSIRQLQQAGFLGFQSRLDPFRDSPSLETELEVIRLHRQNAKPKPTEKMGKKDAYLRLLLFRAMNAARLCWNPGS
jgi:hypothetical protein